MKKLVLLIVAFITFSASAVTPTVTPTSKIDAKTYFFPLGETGKTISFYELAHSSKKEIQEKTGNKLNFFEALALKKVQKKLKKMIDADGNITLKNNKSSFDLDGETGFHLGGFALGFVVGLIGVLIAYLIKDDKKRNRVKWSWIGLAIRVVITLILILAILNGLTP